MLLAMKVTNVMTHIKKCQSLSTIALLFKTTSTQIDYQMHLVELAYRCSPSVATLSKMNAVGTGTKFLCSSNGGSWESPFLGVQPLYTTTISYLANCLLYDQILMCLLCFGARNNNVSLCFNKN